MTSITWFREQTDIGGWVEAAACRGADTNLWFPHGRGITPEANGDGDDAMSRRVLALAAYLGCIIGANAALDRWGMVVVLGHLLPAGVWFAGASFTLRDVLDDLGGRAWVLAAILAGGAISYLFAPSFAVASAAAFLLSESFDWAVYRPLRQRRWWAAVVLSNAVGSTADSLLFLWLAFGSVAGWFPLTVAKAAVTVPFLPVVWWWRRR